MIPDICLLESCKEGLRNDQVWQWQALVRKALVEGPESCAISSCLCPRLPCPVLAAKIFYFSGVQMTQSHQYVLLTHTWVIDQRSQRNLVRGANVPRDKE